MRALRHFVTSGGRSSSFQDIYFNEPSTLIFSAVTLSTLVNFAQIAPKLMRILHDKNEQIWSSRFGGTCIVLIL